jgi:hypothetical protein
MRTRSGTMLCGEHIMLIGERCIPSVESTSSHSFGELAPIKSARPSRTTSRSVRVLSHRVGPLGASVWVCSRAGRERVPTPPEIGSPARCSYTVRCICLLCIVRFTPEGGSERHTGWLHAAQRLSRVKEQCPKALATRYGEVKDLSRRVVNKL